MPTPTIVLVHGAWADGSSWNPVSTELQGQGYTVLTPPNLLRGVAGDAAYVASFLAQRTTGPVVLVGHSYGGVVITNAGDRRGDVKALVYVDAFIPEVGENVFDDPRRIGLRPRRSRPDDRARPRRLPRRARGRRRGVPQAVDRARLFRPGPAGGRPLADRRQPAPDRPRRQRGPDGVGRVEDIPSWAVVGTEDRVIPPATQRSMAERAGSTITEVAGLARVDGVAPRRHDRRHPGRGRHRRGVIGPAVRQKVTPGRGRGRGGGRPAVDGRGRDPGRMSAGWVVGAACLSQSGPAGRVRCRASGRLGHRARRSAAAPRSAPTPRRPPRPAHRRPCGRGVARRRPGPRRVPRALPHRPATRSRRPRPAPRPTQLSVGEAPRCSPPSPRPPTTGTPALAPLPTTSS